MANCPPTNVKFQFRRATYDSWGSTGGSQTILRDGEPGFEADTGQLKIGYAGIPWKDLPYVGGNDIARNIGLNAYINSATANVTYDPASSSITATTVLYGNSSYYNLTFGLSPSQTYQTTASLINNASTIFNNLAPTAAGGTVGHRIHTHTMPLSLVSTGDNTLQIDITTQNAGGRGQGSTFSLTVPIYITSADPMGSPVVSIVGTLSMNVLHLTKVSGVDYYTDGTVITFPFESLTFTNIYNVIPFNPSSLPNNFLGISNSAGGGPSLVNTYMIHYNPGAVPFAYTNVPLRTYLNTGFTYTITGPSYSTPIYVNLTATNTKGLSGSATYSNIGYIGSGWNISLETNIPLGLNGSAIAGVTSITRVSIPSSAGSPTTPAAFQTSSDTNVTIYDPIYLPYTQTFYASNSTAAAALSGIRMPSAFPSNEGIRFLSLQIANTAVLQSFTLKIGRPGTFNATIQNVYVKWYDSSTTQVINPGSKTYGWYNANIPFGDATGCQNGFANAFTYQIKINTTDLNTYSLANRAAGGNIWINIQFTGTILLNDIGIV